MKTTNKFMGFLMTKAHEEEVKQLLADNISDRYNNEEYWDLAIIEQYIQDTERIDEE